MGIVSRIFPATLNIKERMSNPAVRQSEIIAALGIMDTPFHAVCIFPLSHMQKRNGRLSQLQAILSPAPDWKTNRCQKNLEH